MASYPILRPYDSLRVVGITNWKDQFEVEMRIDLQICNQSVTTIDGLSELHAKLAEQLLERERVQLELERQINQLRENAERYARSLAQDIAQYVSQIYEYVEAHKANIVRKGQKSIATPSGRIGYRKSKNKVILTKGVDKQDVIESLRRVLKEGAKPFIKVEESLDLQAIKQNFDQVQDIKGLEYVEGIDHFFIEVEGQRLEVNNESVNQRIGVN